MFRDDLARGAHRRLYMPLLSQPVVEACLRVPTWMRIAGGINRSVARSAFSDVLPRAIRERRSKGTFTSYSGAAFRKNKALMPDFLLSGQLQAQQVLDTEALRAFFDIDGGGPRNPSFQRVFELCMVENWVRHQHQSSRCASGPPGSSARHEGAKTRHSTEAARLHRSPSPVTLAGSTRASRIGLFCGPRAWHAHRTLLNDARRESSEGDRP